MRAVFLDLASLNPYDLDLGVLRGCLPDWHFHQHTDPEQVAQRINHAQVVVSNKVPLNAASIQESPALKLICVAATGTNNVDLAVAESAGVVVSNARDYATASVVEHVFSLLLTLNRRLDRYRWRVRQGDWSRSRHFCLFDETIEELAGERLGIIGYGVLGYAVATVARAFGMQVDVAQRLHDSPLPDRVPLQQLLETSDIISLHCPLTEHTRGLIGASQLRCMRDSALLINTARGGIVDERALLQGLQQGWIAGAGIDVLADEPPHKSNPLLHYHSERLIVTPHVGWASRAARQRLVEEIAANISAFAQGTPRNRVA
jgi:glycerate dehydrogenase